MVKFVQVVPYDPNWIEQFDHERQHLQPAIGKNLLAIYHVGSTSIPCMYAKPIIDMLAEVQDITMADDQTPVLEQLGYQAMGEFGIPGRRYFRKHNAVGVRTHHLHMFQTASDEIVRHLRFRDYMIAHPEAAQAYSQLKQHLAAAYPTDIDAYMDGKDAFIKQMDMKAQQWALGRSPVET